MFSCVWLHFKKCFEKYFLVFGCVLENTIENTFSTCCSHFLIFSRLPNEYIISFIPQYRNTNKTQKKNHQIQTLRAIAVGSKVRSRSARCFARSRWSWRTISADDLGDLGGWSRRSKLWTILASSAVLVAWSVISKGSLLSLLSFSCSLSLLRVTWKWFEGKMKV